MSKGFPYLADYLTYGGLVTFGLVCAIGASLTPGNSPIGLAILWAAAVGFIVCPLAWFFVKFKNARKS